MTEQNDVDDQVVDIEPYEGEPDHPKSLTDDEGRQDDEEDADA